MNAGMFNRISLVEMEKGILALGDAEVPTDRGAPPFMGDVVIPISDPCSVSLVERSIRVAQILDATADEFGLVIQYGVRKS